MQNLISEKATIKLDEVLSSAINANNSAKTAQGNDFSKIFNSIDNSNRNQANQLCETKNSQKNTAAKNSPAKNSTAKNDVTNTKESNLEKTKNAPQKTDDTNKTTNVSTCDTKTTNTDSSDTCNTKEQTTGENIEDVIQTTLQNVEEAVEQAPEGKLDEKIVNEVKAALESILKMVENNEMVLSEDTINKINETLETLTSCDPKSLEAKVLAEDLKQLQKDIAASSFETNAQRKIKAQDDNPNKALEIKINNDDSKKIETQETKTTQNTKTEEKEPLVQVSKNVVTNTDVKKETIEQKGVQKNPVEQDMLDKMDVKIEEIFLSKEGSSNSGGSTFQNAQDEVIRLQIENVENEQSNPAVFSLNKATPAAKPLSNTASVSEINKSDILNQVSSKFEQLKDGTNTKVTMTLKPENLGRVTIQLMHNANGISTNIIAQNQQVKELLDKNLDILKQQLTSQGVNIQNVQVKAVEQNAETTSNNTFDKKSGEEENQQPKNQEQNKKNQQGQEKRNFSFARENIIENADFENPTSQNTAQIHTLAGKIRYNI